jgi:L-ribulose-5-phosphate 4-epimerase
MDGTALDERLSALRDEVWRANLRLVGAGLVTLSFGNASGIDRAAGIVLIKPSGAPYEELRPADLVAVSLADGYPLHDGLRPSSDTPTHLVLYRRFAEIGGVVHTHSVEATAWAQAHRVIPPLGTTHADHFHGAVPVTRDMTAEEIDGEYELATGLVIIETLEATGLVPLAMPAVLVASHGPFTWGADPTAAVDNAIALETVAAMARRTLALEPSSGPVGDALLERHHRRKHGPDAYYGQERR